MNQYQHDPSPVQYHGSSVILNNNNTQNNYHDQNAIQQIPQGCSYNLCVTNAQQENLNELQSPSHVNNGNQYAISSIQQSISMTHRSQRDKTYNQEFNDIYLRLAHLCDLQAPDGGRFSRKVSERNKHMSKKGILGKVEEWIVRNKELKAYYENLFKEKQLTLQMLEIKNIQNQQKLYEFQEEIAKLRRRIEELQKS